MTRTLIALDHARCVVLDGDPDSGAQQAATVLGALPAEYRSGLITTRAAEVDRTIPPAARTLASARTLRAILG